jgi:hypothetical protein
MADLPAERRRFSALLPLVVAGIALVVAYAWFAWFYLVKRQAFFDDVFIYLHMARNASDFGTWQYFPMVDRPALLASSPVKITLLSIAAWATVLFGHAERTFDSAKLVLVVYAPLAWLMWWPFWRKHSVPFLLLGAAYFALALALDATVDFEGGLLFFWVATLVALTTDSQRNLKAIGWALPIGFLIRPDVAFPVVVAVLVLLGIRQLRPLALHLLLAGAVLGAAWVLLCWIMDVWPIPATYWAKAAIPKIFEEKYMIELFFERVGWVTGFRLLGSPAAATVLGALIVFGFLFATVNDRRAKTVAAVTGLIVIALLYRAPANFWWYYQNVVLAMLGATAGLVLRHSLGAPENRRLVAAASPLAFTLFVFVVLMFGKGGQDGPHLWNVSVPSRAQGYQYLASRALGDGTYDLPGIGRVLIKNPEMGMTNYFAGGRGWIWDSAGLAQPLDDPKVSHSPLRHFFPPTVRRSVRDDARILADRAGVPLRVVEVWAMEDRNFEAARKACRYVIVEGAICANDFNMLQ